MFKALQTNNGSNGATRAFDGSTELILDNDYTKKAIEFIQDAHREIRICAYAWRWYDNAPDDKIQKFNIAIVQAIQRGVTVRALVERVNEGSVLKRYGISVQALNTNRTLHTKAILIDDTTLIVGSHNYTMRAQHDNFEASIATQDTECCLQFENYFDRLWQANGKNIY